MKRHNQLWMWHYINKILLYYNKTYYFLQIIVMIIINNYYIIYISNLNYFVRANVESNFFINIRVHKRAV